MSNFSGTRDGHEYTARAMRSSGVSVEVDGQYRVIVIGGDGGDLPSIEVYRVIPPTGQAAS